jgi:KaiC/GvpD/RAD55 family RecA-like ATPase
MCAPCGDEKPFILARGRSSIATGPVDPVVTPSMYDLGQDLENATVDPGTNILISGPPLTGKRRLAMEILAAGADDGEGSVIVTTRDSSDRVIADYRSLVENPDETTLGVVDCVTQHQGRSVQDSDTVKYASSPVDMTGIGIKFSEFLEGFYSDRGITQNRVMLDSLSTLLMYSDLQTVFRFMHVFTSRIENADALGVHVIESTAHDAEAMNTLKQLFDGVVEVDADRERSIQLPGPDTGVPGT